ncbi:MAG TPA: hypothetical protein VGI12_01315 [Vicinamibacterales bacterium]
MTKLFACAAVLALTVAGAAAQTPAASADPVGTWNASFNTQQGVIPATLKLQKDGEKLSGTITSQEGSSPLEAEIKGKSLSVWFNYSANGQAIPVEMTGTVDGDSAKGTMTAGGSPAGDWTATKAKDTKEPAGKVDLSGDWNASLQLDTITATPTFSLKQDGNKLTGEYVSQQYGKFPLTGEITGTAVTLTVSMNIEGNALAAVYSGVLQPDGSLKGTVDIGGGAMAGTFSASRKK